MSVADNLRYFHEKLAGTNCRLVAVSKTKPPKLLAEAYAAGQRLFGENKVQEMVAKQEVLPPDIEWHMIGHLQRNKVKYLAPFVHLIQSVDSLRLLAEIDKQAQKNDRVIDCLLQCYIAEEDTKFGLDLAEAEELLQSEEFQSMRHVRVTGLMGVATNTENQEQLRQEFRKLKAWFDRLKETFFPEENAFREISMGMSSDFELAVAEGSTFIRVGSSIFGARD